MSRDSWLLERTFQFTEISDHDKPMAAIVANGNKIVSVGVNEYKTSPHQKSRYGDYPASSVHAEVSALRSLGVFSRRKNYNRLNFNGTIYISRMLRSGKPGLAKPCNGCMNIIKTSGLVKIVYSTGLADVGEADWFDIIEL